MQPLSYAEFRTELTYYDVYHMIWSRSHKRRRGVLGAWRELKQKMYKEYLREYEHYQKLGFVVGCSDAEIPW